MYYDEFTRTLPDLIDTLGDNRCLAIFGDKAVNIFFHGAPNVCFIVKSKRMMNKEMFSDLNMTCKGARHNLSFFHFLISEMKINWLFITLAFFLMGPFFIIQDNQDFIKELNSTIVSATSILIGVFLVFITFFYLGKENEIEYVAEGRFHTHLMNDKYIIMCSFMSILLSITAIGVAYYEYSDSKFISESLSVVSKPYMYILKLNYQHVVAGILSLLSIIFFWVSFKAMTSYYFQRIKNNIDKNAIHKIHDQFFNKK